MKNAVIYARFSSHAQNEQSIEGQLAECYNFAQRNDLRITHEYIDRALTGTTDKRPEFLQMIEDSKRKGGCAKTDISAKIQRMKIKFAGFHT